MGPAEPSAAANELEMVDEAFVIVLPMRFLNS